MEFGTPGYIFAMALKLNKLPIENPSHPPFSKGRHFPLFGKEGPGEISKFYIGTISHALPCTPFRCP